MKYNGFKLSGRAPTIIVWTLWHYLLSMQFLVFKCECPPGFKGDRCEEPTDPDLCGELACKEDEICVVVGDGSGKDGHVCAPCDNGKDLLEVISLSRWLLNKPIACFYFEYRNTTSHQQARVCGMNNNSIYTPWYPHH